MADVIDLTTKQDERTIAEALNLARFGEPVPAKLAEQFDIAAERLLAKSADARVFVRDAEGQVEIIRPPKAPPWYATSEGRFKIAILCVMACSTVAIALFR